MYQEPNRIASLPLGGSTRQKRHSGGRSRSSSVGAPSAWVSISRGSIHSLRVLTVSPLPAPSTPAISTITGNALLSRKLSCAFSSAVLSRGTSRR